MDELIILLNIAVILAIGYAGIVMLLQMWGRLTEWPPASMAVFGGLFICVALTFAQLSLARLQPESVWYGRNSVMTVATRVACVTIALVLASRVQRRTLLTPVERKRIDETRS